jgi:hypothetical protein
MINIGQIIADSARERGKERLLRLLQRIQNDKREAMKLAAELGYTEQPVRDRRADTYCLIDAL